MKIFKLNLSNIRGYAKADVELSPTINLIIGENNSGKTTLLRTLMFLHDRASFASNDIRINETKGSIQIVFTGDVSKYFNESLASAISSNEPNHLNIEIDNDTMYLEKREINLYGSEPCLANLEPKNYIYPFLSKRKVPSFNEDIRASFANSVSGNLSNLSAKVDRINTDNLPAKDEYIKACNDILGFNINSFPSVNGKKAVYIVSNFDNIPLEWMGEGVANILGLILDLCVAKDKLFLIEEPENDIHPKALKKLLNLIIEKSETNQFIITTHSNIVLKHLASSQSSKIFKVNMEFENKIPTSSVFEVDNSPKARREILEDLGYELFDFDVWDTWLILEESSAEVIIREFLIPNFAASLKDRLRTIAAGGIDKVAARFEAWFSLCLFLHLQKTFDHRIWVLVDGGENEEKIINDLKNKYKTWNQERFCQFKQHDFEKYYPEIFQPKVEKVLQIQNKRDKKKAKEQLLEEVKNWYIKEPDIAKEYFSKSASEVIEILMKIERDCNLTSNKGDQ